MPIYLQHGNLIDYVPPTDTSTEDVVFMGGLVGIPQAFIPAGELGALSVDGVYIFNKKDGVSVNLGDVVKYCGTTKLAQDSNADLTLGVAVAKAEADDFGVKVKINSVLPTDGGGGGGGDGLQNLATGTGALSILGEATTSDYSVSIGSQAGAIVRYSTAIGYGAEELETGSTVISAWNNDGTRRTQLHLVGAGSNSSLGRLGGKSGLWYEDEDGNYGTITFESLTTGGGLKINSDAGLEFDCGGQLTVKVCTASGLGFDSNGYLTYNG